MMPTVKRSKPTAKKEFGDFQTPYGLALSACRILAELGIRPGSIVEPTCGRGAFITAATVVFPDVRIVGVDINPSHLAVAGTTASQRVELRQGDFFKIDWNAVVTKDSGPWLILGNPPWITSSELGSIASDNLPAKSNFHGRPGIEAITGKSNFDISEWMILRYLDWLQGREGTIAVLCKTAVARKILLKIWKSKSGLRSARIYKIDALDSFGAAVDACFFVVELDTKADSVSCEVFADLYARDPLNTLGFLDGHVITDIGAFKQYRDLLGPEQRYIWRSGVKHDCSKVMELKATPKGYENGLGELVDLEEDLLFPMLKSSDVGNGRVRCGSVMLVTQKAVGEDTRVLKTYAPRTWKYLEEHEEFLRARASVIYRSKPAFSIFGIGPYSFAPWKLAISALYKKLNFVKVGPWNGKPVVFDDTVNFIPCWSEEEADFVSALLSSQAATAFFNSMIHWDEKRPITVDLLRRLNIRELAARSGSEGDYLHFTESKGSSQYALPTSLSA